MKLHTLKLLVNREDLQSENAPFDITKTDESIEMPEEDLLMSILHRIITEGREEGEKRNAVK